MIAAEQIEKAKEETPYQRGLKVIHEHDDCIRIAVSWLSAQERTAGPMRKSFDLKHMIERWGGRYVSQADVEVAAQLLGLKGQYPQFNISSRLTRPLVSRLLGIGEAFAHQVSRDDLDKLNYTRREE